MVWIDTAQIPSVESRAIGLAFAAAVRAFFQDPVIAQDFKEFMERRDSNESEKHHHIQR